MSIEQATKLTDAVAGKYANLTKANINVDIDIARALAQTFTSYNNIPAKMRDRIYKDIIKDVLIKNQNFLSVWVNWELSAIDSSYTKPYGRIRISYYRSRGTIIPKDDTLNLQGDNFEGAYYRTKVSQKEVVTDPYFFSYTNAKVDEVLESSVGVPIIIDGKFAGLTGVDVGLERFEKIIQEIRPYENSYAFLVANNGRFVVVPDKKLVNESVIQLGVKPSEQEFVLENIRNGKQFSFFYQNAYEEEFYVSFSPFQIGNSQTSWAVGIMVPVKIIMQEANSYLYISMLVACLGLIILSVVIWLIARELTKPLLTIAQTLESLSKGEIDESKKIHSKRTDELAEIQHSMNSLVDGLNRIAKFAVQIGEGNLLSQFTPLSEKDSLGNALLEMRKSLQLAHNEDIKRKEGDKKMNWATQGAAQFAEILRHNNDNIEVLSYNIVSNLVKYLLANQGGLFLINNTDKDNLFVELTAAYAYERKKMLQKKIPWGVGLIGRCILESETIYISDLPEDYINITSGLGESVPSSLLLIPLKFNREAFGVIELASFNEFEPYQIQFVEKIGESIASTLSSVKINLRTVQLLEESRIQSEELAAQEEEMRQNMEEMQATQEELSRKANEISNVLDAINTISYVAEYDMQGKLTEINDSFLAFIGMTKEEMVGKYQGSFDSETSYEQRIEKFKSLWEDLRAGKSRREIQHVHIAGKEFWLSEVYTPIYDEAGLPYKVLNISIDITNSMQTKLREQNIVLN